jgi:hypothetical protein
MKSQLSNSQKATIGAVFVASAALSFKASSLLFPESRSDLVVSVDSSKEPLLLPEELKNLRGGAQHSEIMRRFAHDLSPQETTAATARFENDAVLEVNYDELSQLLQDENAIESRIGQRCLIQGYISKVGAAFLNDGERTNEWHIYTLHRDRNAALGNEAAIPMISLSAQHMRGEALIYGAFMPGSNTGAPLEIWEIGVFQKGP